MLKARVVKREVSDGLRKGAGLRQMQDWRNALRRTSELLRKGAWSGWIRLSSRWFRMMSRSKGWVKALAGI